MPNTGARLDVPPTVADHEPSCSSAATKVPRREILAASPSRSSRLSALVESRFAGLSLLVCGLAVAIASVNLRHVSLWVDESYTVSVATRSPADLWRLVQTVDIVHALYNAMLHPWFQAVGVSEITVRAPSLLAVGVATAGVMVLAKRLVNPQVAVLAGLVFAVLPRVTWMGIEGRSYAATTALAVWWTVLFVSIVGAPRWPKLIGYAVLTAFAGSLNIFLVLLVGVHGVSLLLDARRGRSRSLWMWSASAAVGVIGSAPVIWTAMRQSDQIGPTRLGPLGYVRSVAVNQWFLGDTPTTYYTAGSTTAITNGSDLWKVSAVGSTTAITNGSDLWKVSAVLLAVTAWALIAYGLAAPSVSGIAQLPPKTRFRPLLAAWLVLPTAALVGYSLVGAQPIYNPRYLSHATPAVAILIAIGIAGVLAKARARHAGRIALVSMLTVAVVLTVPVYASQRTQWAKSGADWSGVAAFIATHRDRNPQAAHEGIYYAPRSPGLGHAGAAATTARTLQPIYPGPVAGLRDITLQASAAAQADLTGRSAPLASAAARLRDLDKVFVVRRRDYPASALTADDQVLTAAGLHPTDAWSGPLNVVVEYVR